MHILSTDKLSLRFDQCIAVDALTLLVATGEMFFLLGRNGVERRSLINILTILCVIRVI